MPDSASLGDLVSGLGFELVRVVVAPRGLDVGVGDPIIHDRLVGTRLAAGDVVLAVGVDPGSGEMAELVRAAAASNAAALIGKFADDVPAALVDEAAASGVALLRATRDVEWGQLHALARMVTSTAATRDHGDPLLGDLFGLANAIAARTGGPVTIEDAQSRVLAYSTGEEAIDDYRRDTILGRRVPEEWIRRLQQDGAFRRIWQSDAPVRISYAATEPSYRDRMVMAVRAGTEVVGSIWVQEGDRPLDEVTEHTLAEVAPLAALHLVRHFAGDVERRQESELLGAVLAGRAPASTLGSLLAHRRGHVVSVLAVRALVPEPAEASMHLARVASVVSLYRRTERAPIAAAAAGDTMYLAITAADDRTDAVVKELLERARTSVRAPLAAALAHSDDGLEGLHAARREADAVLRVRSAAEGRPAMLDDVLGAVTLDRWRELTRGRPELLRGRVEALAGDDRTRRQYAATLRSYLDHLGDVSAAAAHLGVHPNTFRYRLRRAVETAGLDLADPVERLVAHLHLHLLDGDDGDEP
jgi:hypothetical protein